MELSTSLTSITTSMLSTMLHCCFSIGRSTIYIVVIPSAKHISSYPFIVLLVALPAITILGLLWNYGLLYYY